MTAKQGLDEVKERFSAAFDESPTGMAILDLDGLLTEVNDAFGEMLGYRRSELEDVLLWSLAHPDDVETSQRGLAEMRAGTRTSFTADARYLNTGGYLVSCALRAIALSGPDGSPRAVLAHFQDNSDRKRHAEQLEYAADHDPLTGLLNRRAFTRELSSHIERAPSCGSAGAVLVIDLDHFKLVNDTFGPQAGDELLGHVAQRLRSRLRATDMLGRIGGDEFAVLLPKAGLGAAERVARSVLAAVRDAIPTSEGERRITASAGVAAFSAQAGVSADDVMVNVDLALSDAKDEGRDRCAKFSTDELSQARMKGRVTWAQRIRHALDNDGFSLLAQPIVALIPGATTQYELLLRMQDDDGSLIPPAAFLQVAERLDLITDIDAWVTTRAIQMLKTYSDLTFEVNLSARSLGDPALLRLIQRELRNTGVAPERLIFEITETAALTSVSRARAFGDQLSTLGCRFALDDFGAGFGSFYYLKHLVFDYVKIDGEFIRDCCAGATDQLVIQAIVAVARGMNKHTVAEFVGDEETVQLLTALGVDYGQGYHLGEPAPLEDHLGAMLARGD